MAEKQSPRRMGILLCSVFVILLLAFLPIVMYISQQAMAYTQSASDFLTYENPTYGIRIQYPSDWEKTDVQGVVVQFSSPKESDSDTSVGFFNIVASELLKNMTLDELTESTINNLKTGIQDFKLIESSATTLAGSPAHKVVYTAKYEQAYQNAKVSIDLELMQVWTVKINKAYVITYGAALIKYSDYLATAQRMINSFEIDTSIMPQEVSGKYVNAEVGLQIEFPAGWSGLKAKQGNMTMVAVSPTANPSTGKPNLFMGVGIMNISTLASEQLRKNTSESGCKETSVAFTKLNGMSTLEMVMECDNPQGFTKMKMYILATEGNALAVMYSAPSNTGYDSNIAEFEKSVKTLQVKDTVDIASALVPYVGVHWAKPSKHTVEVGGNPYDIEFSNSANTNITNFTFSEENKQLSFKVEGKDGTKGTTFIDVSKVLEAPYTVMIDGVVTEDLHILKDQTGATTLAISYTHSIHDITITGTKVIPEFPIPMIGVIAAVIGSVAIMGRTKLHKL